MQFIRVKRTDPSVVTEQFINGSGGTLTKGGSVSVTASTTVDGVSVSTPTAVEGGFLGVVYGADAASGAPVLVQVYGYNGAAHVTNTATVGQALGASTSRLTPVATALSAGAVCLESWTTATDVTKKVWIKAL